LPQAHHEPRPIAIDDLKSLQIRSTIRRGGDGTSVEPARKP
jgi:hypothetical protein